MVYSNSNFAQSLDAQSSRIDVAMDPLKFQVIRDKLPTMLPFEKGGSQLFPDHNEQANVTKEIDSISSQSNESLFKSEETLETSIKQEEKKVPFISTDKSDNEFPIDSSLKKEMPIESVSKSSNKLVVVGSAGSKYVWGMNADGELFHGKHGEIGLEWEKLSGGHHFSDFSVAAKGYLFVIGASDHFLYRLDPFNNRISRAIENDDTRFQMVSAVNWDSAYCITEDNQILHFDKDKFTLMSGSLKKLSVGGPVYTGLLGLGSSKMELWGIDLDDRLVRYNPENNTWQTYPLEVQDVAAGKDLCVYIIRKSDLQLMKLDRERDVFQFQPQRPLMGHTGDFHNLRFRNISAYKEGQDVYAVDYDTGDIIKLSK